MRKLRSAILLLLLALTSAATAQTPQEHARVEAVNRLIEILEDPALRTQLLDHLKLVSGVDHAGRKDDSSEALDYSADTAVPRSILDQGLIAVLSDWSNEFLIGLPNTTFGMPIDQKAGQAWTQIVTRTGAGLEDGRLPRFAAWALPSLLVLSLLSFVLHRLARKLVMPTTPVGKRRLAAGLLVKTVAYVGLFFLVSLVVFVTIPAGVGTRIFFLLSGGMLFSLMVADLSTAGLSALAGIRGPRFISYCRVRFYPWLGTITLLASGAAICLDPEVRRSVGWSAADVAAFALNC